MVGDTSHDGRKICWFAQGGIATRNLNVRTLAVLIGEHVDTAHDLGKRQVMHGFRTIREIAKRAIEIAALGYLEADAAYSKGASANLRWRPKIVADQSLPQAFRWIVTAIAFGQGMPCGDVLGTEKTLRRHIGIQNDITGCR